MKPERVVISRKSVIDEQKAEIERLRASNAELLALVDEAMRWGDWMWVEKARNTLVRIRSEYT